MKPVLNVNVAMRRALLLACVVVLSGCSMFASDNSRYDPAPLTQLDAGATARVIWRASPGSGAGVPVVVGEAVYAASENGGVGKFLMANGRPVWQTRVNVRLAAGVGSDGSVTAVVSRDGEVIALDDTGRELWRNRATSEVLLPPVVGNGVVVVRSGDYRVQAFDASNGERIWSVQRPGPVLALRAPAGMAMTQGVVLTGLPGGRLLMIHAATGAVQWEGIVASPKGASDLERVTDVVGAPQIAGALLCAVAYQGRIACFDMSQGGQLAWAKDYSSASGMTVAGRFAFASDTHGRVTGFALEDGSVLWMQTALRNRRLSAPAVVNGAIAVGDFAGYVHFLSPQDGKLLARISAGKGPILAPLQATPDGVLVQDANGALALLQVFVANNLQRTTN